MITAVIQSFTYVCNTYDQEHTSVQEITAKKAGNFS